MALVYENLKKCAVKISAYVGGVPSIGSGIVYQTPNYLDYYYVITAKHILQEDSFTHYEDKKIYEIKIEYSLNGNLSTLEIIKQKNIKDKVLVLSDDIVILILDKNNDIIFPPIQVSDELKDDENDFFSWGIFKANEDELNNFKFKRSDHELKRIELISKVSNISIPGLSGGGVFLKNKNILYGIISRYPNKHFENSIIECTRLKFEEINLELKKNKRIELDTIDKKHKREIKGNVVEIYQSFINNTFLNLELARRRLQTDIIDDWYYDSLKYIDLLNQEYLFKQFEKYFFSNKYKTSKAEIFYVPKKNFTLRQAYIFPFIDRIIYMAIVEIFADKMDKALLPNVFSARYNRQSTNQIIINGVEQWKKMQYKIAEVANEKEFSGIYKYNCIIEIDLLNFYDNIDKGLLIKKIERITTTTNEKNALIMLKNFLYNYSNKKIGLPQNSDASALLATFYLNQLDVFINNQTFAYYRFMDDIRILCKDKYEARCILKNIEHELKRCHLSVNSQKTQIKTFVNIETEKKDELVRNHIDKNFDFEISKINRLSNASNYQNRNLAFHSAIELLENNIDEDTIDEEESARKLNFALNTIEKLVRKNLNLLSLQTSFFNSLLKAVETLKDKPWITTQICKILSLVHSSHFNEHFKTPLKEIILNEKYNIYTFQLFQIWQLFAKHKIKENDLITFAAKSIEKNDKTSTPVIASMIIYICSVDKNYKRIILRKYEENFTDGYYQDRATLIALRSFNNIKLDTKLIHKTLKHSFKFTNKYGNKDLVYIQGIDEEEEDDQITEQLYSI